MPRLACFLDPGRSLDEAVERVRLAERLGYESAWVTHIAAREPLQVLARYAAATERIGLGTGVIPLVARHPIATAMEAATLDEASGGRLRLGIGVSHRLTVEEWYGEHLDDPIGRMREYATIVRTLFREGSVRHEGSHYTARFSFMGMAPRPGIRLVFAALAPRMLRLAAELADGVVLWMCSPTYIREHVRPVLDEALASAGRDAADFDVVAAVPTALTENPSAAGDAFRRQAMPYTQLPFYRKVIAAAGYEDVLAAADAGEELPDRFVEDMTAIGDAERIQTKVEAYRDAGVTLPAIGPLPRHEGAAGVEATLSAAAPDRS